MIDFEQLLREDIASYKGRHNDLICQAPEIYHMFNNILEDPNLPGRYRPLVIAAIAYFIIPTDIMPEDLEGPYGYIDDIFFSAYVANHLRDVLGDDEIFEENWEGKQPIIPLLERILAQEKELIGEKLELILWYIGYEYLINHN